MSSRPKKWNVKMSSRNEISVVMCTYNGEAYLEEQLASIAMQIRLPDELIICDDGSVDSTLRILKDFSCVAPFPVRIIINKVNLGSTKNFEKAIKLATGEIIALADQDDVWDNRKLYALEATLKDSNIGYAFSDGDIIREDGAVEGGLWSSFKFGEPYTHCFSPETQVPQLLKQNVVTGATMAFRRSLVPLVTPIPPNWFHDGWIALIASSCGFNGTALPLRLIKYRQHSGQQVGPGRTGLNHFFYLAGRLRARHKEFLSSQKAQFELAHQHLMKLRNESKVDVEKGLLWVEEKINHINARLLITLSPMPRRLVAVRLEYQSGRYHIFSKGGWAALKDVV